MWADLTITRDDIDSFEGATFAQYNSPTVLGIAMNDSLTLDMAKSQLEDDIVRTISDVDMSDSELLDALFQADERGLLKRMLTYKFLANWFKQDASKEDSLAWAKAREYIGEYQRALHGGLASLAPKLDTPKQIPRYRMVR